MINVGKYYNAVVNYIKDLNTVDTNYMRAMNTWVNSLSYILLLSKKMSVGMQNNISTLVHCSDGWDRTS